MLYTVEKLKKWWIKSDFNHLDPSWVNEFYWAFNLNTTGRSRWMLHARKGTDAQKRCQSHLSESSHPRAMEQIKAREPFDCINFRGSFSSCILIEGGSGAGWECWWGFLDLVPRKPHIPLNLITQPTWWSSSIQYCGPLSFSQSQLWGISHD